MARGLRRGPVLLRFRSLVDSIAGYVAGIVDTRQLSKVRYTLRDCYLSAVALFYVQDRSLLQFQRRFQRKFQANKGVLVLDPELTANIGQLDLPLGLRGTLLVRHDGGAVNPRVGDKPAVRAGREPNAPTSILAVRRLPRPAEPRGPPRRPPGSVAHSRVPSRAFGRD